MRGTGKTTKLLKATPQGGVFIVQSAQMVKYVERWIKESGRELDDILVIPVDNLQQLAGLPPRPITIDHCVTETMDLLLEEQGVKFLVACALAPFVIKCDEDGDIATLWGNMDVGINAD
jgi:hypothetical protein